MTRVSRNSTFETEVSVQSNDGVEPDFITSSPNLEFRAATEGKRLGFNTWLFWVLISFATIFTTGLYDFHTRGEAREAIVAKRIFNSGDWIATRGYGHVVASKPPLLHWMGAASSRALGNVSEFSLRIPSAVAAMALALLFLLVTKTELTGNGRLLFLLLLSFSFEWCRASFACRVDMVHSAALCASIILGYRAALSEKHLLWISVGITASLAVLAKGPVGIVLPTAVLGAWILFSSRVSYSRLIPLSSSMLLAGALSGLWYYAALNTGSQEFAQKVWSENFGRFISSEEAPHRHSALYLLGTMFIGSLPWSLIGACIVFRFRDRIRFRRSTLVRLRSVSSYFRAFRTLPSVNQLCVVAIVTIVGFYCIPASKRSVYILGAYPFMALLAAKYFQHIVGERAVKRMLIVSLISIVTLQGIVFPFFVAPKSSERVLGEVLRERVPATVRIFSVGFEFYGASFYSGREMYRLEETKSDYPTVNHPDPPRSGDYVIVFDRDLALFAREFPEVSSAKQEVTRVWVGGSPVEVLRIALSPG